MIFDLFDINGRINRLTWWMTLIFITATGLIYYLLFAAPVPSPSIADPKTAEDFAIVAWDLTQAILQDPVLIGLQVFTSWLFTTTSVQRMHDRGNSGWRMIIAFVPLVLLAFSIYLFSVPQTLVAGLLTIMLALAGMYLSALWLIIECGLLSGDDLANSYGPPPGQWARHGIFVEEIAALAEEDEFAEARARALRLRRSAFGKL